MISMQQRQSVAGRSVLVGSAVSGLVVRIVQRLNSHLVNRKRRQKAKYIGQQQVLTSSERQ